MPFVNKSGGDEQRSNLEAAGGPPGFGDLEFDPNDPDTLKVHYDLTGWTFEQRAELSETFAERSVPHVWQGDEVVIPERIEADVDALFDELEAEIGPFPVVLEASADGTEFGLDEWPATSRDMLTEALTEAEIPHRWEGATVVVARDAEHTVDDLLDAIEAGDVASMSDAEAPEGALSALYSAGHELERDPVDGKARERLFELVPQLADDAPPYGFSIGPWRRIVAKARELLDVFESGAADAAAVSEQAGELKAACRPWV